MKRFGPIAAALLAPFFFPWPFAALLALIAGWVSPLTPLAVGLIIDALYYARGASVLIPWATIIGGAAALAALLVRRFLETSIMQW